MFPTGPMIDSQLLPAELNLCGRDPFAGLSMGSSQEMWMLIWFSHCIVEAHCQLSLLQRSLGYSRRMGKRCHRHINGLSGVS